MRDQYKRTPNYRERLASGELWDRAEIAREKIRSCTICPRRCGINRLENEIGSCGTTRHALVSSIAPHFGEEYCLSGSRGSGTVFFAGCNLSCRFCQNWELSHERDGREIDTETLAEGMLRLQSLGCHNINLVSPTHVVPQWLEGLALAAERSLHLPIVYNSGGYDSEETLSLLEGLVDIYMPDIKYTTPDEAERFIGARDYPEISARALRTMHTQVGDLRYGRDGIASAGLLVRHLVMPNNTANAERVLEFLATEISTETVVNIMGQYRPAGESGSDPDLTGRVSRRCIQGLHEYARSLGLHRFPQH